ncbi:hypothetical protein BC939DRAFT_508362 [Gamsiella multidivaricata]|uniref:uncharacterized protein n=1 Tax=Gamsiella multidivaricata TaxID=101098 RepID=UPI00222064C9|nr:uncharacterized protein BC939DRAFT_508362 [Gamsiella multidivaricata]KAG0351579.1 hypothetical protein BGZ54_003183 [Gamsiella multidivaricata]KAI7816376.1 hypothetical protein BC939DRAFT_508362 [Gamsiella multidivaricata]
MSDTSVLQWLQGRITRKEPITMPDFAATFNYCSEQDAHSAFSTLLSSTTIPQQLQVALKDKYEIWRRNDGRNYWASLVASSQIAVTTKRTVAEIVSGCEHVAKKLIQEHSNGMAPSAVAIPSPGPANASSKDDWEPKKVTFLETEFATESERSDSSYIDSNPSSTRSSLNSIDFSFMNRLVGPGTTSSRLNTAARLFVGQVDVSELLLTARRAIVKIQSRITSVSDLLALNFIFNTEFVTKHLSSDISAAIMRVHVPSPAKDEIQVLSKCLLYAACHSFLETKIYIQDNTKARTLLGDLLRAYTIRPGLWQDPSARFIDLPLLPKNEDTYMEVVVKNIIIGVFGDLDIVDHWSRDPLPTPRGFEEAYYPDYYAEKANLPFIVVEVKKPEANASSLKSDKHKLPCMMKIMLDQLLAGGVQDPVVIGYLIQASHCHIFFMALEYEALYLCKLVGSFALPRNNLQLGLLLPALGALHVAHDTARKTLAAIERRTNAGNNMKNKWQRPSYYVKGIRIPAPLPSADDL